MTTTQLAAKILIRIGLVMLIVSALCRMLIPAEGDTVTADLAMMVSIFVVLTGASALLVLRRERERQKAGTRL